MWHEARKAEKALYQQINSTAKRKEQTRRYHELNARDPAELLIIYGTKKKIHDDPVVTKAASEANTMKKWQGDNSVTIDRFDARNLLEILPKRTPVSNFVPESIDQFIENMQVEYERYKELVAVEFTGDTEEKVLKNIAEKERKAKSLRLQKIQNRKKNLQQAVTNKKATIGFSYDDEEEKGESTNSRKALQKPESDSESSDDEEECELFSAKLSSLAFSSNDWERLNKLAEKFQIPRDAFVKIYEVDRGFELDNAKINEIERERLSISGKAGKRDRARLRQTKAVILKDPLNDDAVSCLRRFAERRMDAGEAISDDTMSDGEEKNEQKTIVISTHGGEDNSSSSRKKSKAEISLNFINRQNKDDENFKKLAMLKTRKSLSPFGNDFSMNTGSRSDVKKLESSSSREAQSIRRRRSSSSNSTSSESEQDQQLEIRSSMSDSEKEKIEIQNRKRRIRKTKKEVQRRKVERKPESDDSEIEKKSEAAATRLRQQLHHTLNKTTKEFRNEALEKKIQQQEDNEKRYDEDRYTARHSPHRSISSSPERKPAVVERERENKNYDDRRRRRSPRRSRSPRRRSKDYHRRDSHRSRRRSRSRSRGRY